MWESWESLSAKRSIRETCSESSKSGGSETPRVEEVACLLLLLKGARLTSGESTLIELEEVPRCILEGQWEGLQSPQPLPTNMVRYHVSYLVTCVPS